MLDYGETRHVFQLRPRPSSVADDATPRGGEGVGQARWRGGGGEAGGGGGGAPRGPRDRRGPTSGAGDGETHFLAKRKDCTTSRFLPLVTAAL